ncbi:HWE histidine kinase domain-containing protein [Consotaella salsifontis]|uniref:histidine kinase n=1 Tax=Consotaella salsifontis TaxID=1365950 RepID=A0A1T4Q2D1_9HYPH|nr:HWE histidine kinase domain-containing protein [Consotaella salsifontis]SJZ97889.1 Bacteriophytochrome (light-regulated signal transduction histidine kinase) [Consotaella salsifontis]
MSTPDPTNFKVDLTNCDREPIHLLGGIQGFGFLFAISSDWLVERVSANIGEFLGHSPETMLGEPISTFLPRSTIHAIRGKLQLLSSPDSTERLFAFDLKGDGRLFDVALHAAGSSIIVEAEPATNFGPINPGTMVKGMVARVRRHEDLDGLYRESVRQVRAITGFDRVMLYRFGPRGDGHVIAESARSGIGSFLGLHYPASDIPVQARALYIRNQIRIIADVNAAPVPIVPELNPHGQPLDLSLSVLRSVSPIHIEYLKNMGVGASLSISVVIDGQLWGLFALHHYGPRHLSLEIRSTAELFGQMISLMIEGKLYKQQQLADEGARELHDRFISKIVAAASTVEALADFSEELREMISCDGFAVWSKGEVRTFGRCPPESAFPALARFLNLAGPGRVYSTDALAAVYPDAADFAEDVAGVLTIPISRTPRDYLMFFRREMIHTVTWAGNPAEKEMEVGPNGSRLTPRKSFEEWRETVRGRSEPWSPVEIKAAEGLRVSILEVLVRFNEENERQATSARQRQELLIAELNHRVRNILGLIRALVGQSRSSADSVDEYARIIGGRIQALARAHDQITSESFSTVVLSEIIRTEVLAYLSAKADRVELNGPEATVEANAFSTLALVFHELVTNSAKYGALSDSRGSVRVDWEIDEAGACRINWVENGGPPVSAPQRRGFGSTIIERSIPHDLGGTAALDFQRSGLRAEFTLPAGLLHPHTARKVPEKDMKFEHESEPDQEASRLTGLTGLVVEDNMIISLDAEQLLLDNGMRQVFTAASLADAQRIIEQETIDVALLDVNLGAESSFPLAPILTERDIPFVFATGYGEQLELPEEARDALMVRKPFSAEQLIAAVTKALTRRRSRPN